VSSDERKHFESLLNNISPSGDIFKTSEAISAGIKPRTLNRMKYLGLITQITRGIYCRVDNISSHLDIAVISKRYPNAVICLTSALSFHEITTQIPHAVDMAIFKGSAKPRIKFPPVSVHWFSEEIYSAGVEEHQINGTIVKIYSIEKTIADCFKYRDEIGMDILLEALKMCRQKGKAEPDKMLLYADLCRISEIIQPYLESIF